MIVTGLFSTSFGGTHVALGGDSASPGLTCTGGGLMGLVEKALFVIRVVEYALDWTADVRICR